MAGEPDRLHHVRAGVGLLALRLGDVPIVALGLAGSDDLYRGKRIAVSLLSPVTARELAGGDWPAVPPTPETRDEIRLARLLTDRLGSACRRDHGALPGDRRSARASATLALVASPLLRPRPAASGRPRARSAGAGRPEPPARAFGLVGRLLGFRLELVGAEHLPRDSEGRPVGGWIAAGLPHVTWVEPFVMLVLLPAEPRLVWFGDARAMERSWLRRVAFRSLGGVVPIHPGGGPEAFEGHVAAVQAVVHGGAVFALFPERGPAVPPGEARPIAPGIGYFGLRSGAPIVPIVFGGTHELYRGRRIRMHSCRPCAPPTWPPRHRSPAR